MSVFLPRFVSAVIFLISVFALNAPVQAEGLTKDLYRARVVDYCLYDQWARAKNSETKGIVKGCKCAAKAYVKGLEKDDLAEALENGALSRAQKKVVLTEYAKCRG